MASEKNPTAHHPEFQQSLQKNLQSAAKTQPERLRAEAVARRTSTPELAHLVEDVDTIDLEEHGIHGVQFGNILRNPSVPKLYEYALKYEKGSKISSAGALMCRSGDKTGRSPKDKRIVKEDMSEKDVWWGRVNIPMEERSFLISRERAVDFLNTQKHLFVIDGYAGWNETYRMKIRVICSRAYHALFMYNMLIRPKTREELVSFGHPDFVIYNAGAFPANKYTKDVSSSTSVAISLKERQMVILGTQYAGEMKKGIFSVMHYFLPKRGVLSLHSSANEGPAGDVTLFFGLSGTGKTTLSADPRRKLIGDDEHGWSDSGVFNIEGGCYAKCINLSPVTEPEIFGAIRFGTVLENVEFDPYTREVDYASAAITENTRSSYPIEYIPNAKIPCEGAHPKNIILLSCDAFGVLPPVSKLTPEQAMYYFISGYTAKVAGTEMGVTEPTAAFSACFGDAFLVLHPSVYAEMLAKQIRQHKAQVWLVNTGWNGGPYGVGARVKLRYTRAMIDAIHSGELEKAETWTFPLFNVQVPKKCTGVPDEVLDPTWKDKDSYMKSVNKLAAIFIHNFKQYEDKSSAEIKNAGPQGVVDSGDQIRIAVGMG